MVTGEKVEAFKPENSIRTVKEQHETRRKKHFVEKSKQHLKEAARKA